MDWEGGRRSNNVQDRRGSKMKAGGMGIGGIIIVLIGLFFGVDLNTMLGLVGGGVSGGGQYQQSAPPSDAKSQEQSEFVRVMLGSNEDLWQQQFKRYGIKFRAPTLVLFSQQTQSACGAASSATGPFYCPADQGIYIDLNFIQEMRRMGASNNTEVVGNFALAYVIAHEFGHHISNLTGILPKAHQAMSQAGNKAQANAISVALELQADCFAGVWAANLSRYNINVTRKDLELGLQAASAVGDDRIMASAGRSVNPENFTHGSAQQRMEWFARGLQSGDMQTCDTFQ